MSEHGLKCWPEYYAEVDAGRKTFEIRKDDRGFKVGDVLLLREYEPQSKTYTGRSCRRVVTYVTNFGQPSGYVVMALRACGPALDDVLRDAFEWQMVTFPHASPQSAANHLLVEAKELKDDPTDANEMADVMLLLSSVALQQGIDLAKAVRDKMAINRARKWGKVNEEGYVEHVRDAAIAQEGKR